MAILGYSHTFSNSIIHLFYPIIICLGIVFDFLMGHLHVPGEIANNDYAEFWVVKEVYYRI